MLCAELRGAVPEFDVGPNAARRQLEVKQRLRKCLFLYHYWMHPVFGFMSARVQKIVDLFQVQIYLNGREWLAHQMTHSGLQYIPQENCFPWMEDYTRAQALMDEQLRSDWPKELGAIAQQLNPLHGKMFDGFAADYYWLVIESEWATDVGFRRSGVAAAVPPAGGAWDDEFLQPGRDDFFQRSEVQREQMFTIYQRGENALWPGFGRSSR